MILQSVKQTVVYCKIAALRRHHLAAVEVVLLAPAAIFLTTFQQGAAGGYNGATATYFDVSAGYNSATYLRTGANDLIRSLLQFDVSAIPANAVVDEATLQLYYAGRSNGHTLTLGAHQVLANWTDSQANRTQRQTGTNWNVAGMGSGSDYVAMADGFADVLGGGGSWIELDVTDMARLWIADSADNHGLTLLEEAASGYVTYDFCSELVQSGRNGPRICGSSRPDCLKSCTADDTFGLFEPCRTRLEPVHSCPGP